MNMIHLLLSTVIFFYVPVLCLHSEILERERWSEGDCEKGREKKEERGKEGRKKMQKKSKAQTMLQ